MDGNLTAAEKIQVVINTLKGLEMKPTYENCNYLAGMYKLLVEVRDEIHEKEAAEDAGEADAE